MRTNVMKDFVRMAQETDGPWSAMAKAAIEDGQVFAPVLAKKVGEAGFSIEYRKGKAGVYCEIRGKEKGQPEPVIVAQAYSISDTDALKQAVFAEVKTEAAAKKQAAV